MQVPAIIEDCPSNASPPEDSTPKNKSPRRPCRRRRPGLGVPYLAGAGGLKASANALAFGVPTPVTLSQPTFVCRLVGSVHSVPENELGPPAEQSVPNEMTSAVSCRVA